MILRKPTPFSHHAAALAAFIGLTALLVAPVLGDPTVRAIGHPANDVWNHIWGYWWVYESLTSGRVPIQTDLLSWPGGGSLWFIDAFGAVASAPAQALWGPVAAYNAAVAGQLLMCGVGAYALAWRVTGSAPGAFAAGLAFMSAPHLLGQVYNGISETTAAGWMALALAAVSWGLEAPSARRGALAGAALGVAAMANWYYGLFGALLTGTLLLATAWRRRSTLHTGAILRAALAGGVALLAVVALPFWAFQRSLHAADALVTRQPDFVWMTLILHNMTDLVSLFRPGQHYSPDLKAQFDEDLIVVVYLGHMLLWPALAAVGLSSPRQRRAVLPWLLAFLGFALLSLGPYLFIGGQYIAHGDRWVGLPFLVLFEHMPGFTSVSHAYRFIVGATLALCVMLAFFVRAVGTRRRGAWMLAVTVGLLRVAESLFGSQAVFPIPTTSFDPHPVYEQLHDGAVLDLPVGVPVLARARYSGAQIIHQQPIPYGLNDPTPPFVYRNRLGQYLLELERSRVAFAPLAPPALDLVLGREQLVEEGLRWIVLHAEPLPERQFAKIASFLDLVATPVFADDEVRVYRLDP